MDDQSDSDSWLRSVNNHLGTRIRSRRKQRGMTQTQLGQSLGLTFQQVQKYEQGSNRISAARLPHMAQALDVPVTYFYEGMPSPSVGLTGMAERQHAFSDEPGEEQRELEDLVLAFQAISTPEVRRQVIALLKTMRG